MQRALLQYFLPKNRELVLKALHKAGREDLIGSGPECLVPAPAGTRSAPAGAGTRSAPVGAKSAGAKQGRPAQKGGKRSPLRNIHPKKKKKEGGR